MPRCEGNVDVVLYGPSVIHSLAYSYPILLSHHGLFRTRRMAEDEEKKWNAAGKESNTHGTSQRNKNGKGADDSEIS